MGQDPDRLVVVKKQGCDWGACGRPRKRDLATSLALGDGRDEGGPARRQGPAAEGIAGRKPRDETRPSGG